jgi:transposase
MPKRSQAVHVATIRRIYKGKVYESHLLRRSYREGDKVKHQTLGNLSHLPFPVISLIRRSLQGEVFVAASESFQILRALPHGHVAAILESLRLLDLEHILSKESSRNRDLIVAMIVARILDPCSKLATAQGLEAETATSSLGEVLGISDVEEDELYVAMDWLLPRQEAIEIQLAKRHLSQNTLVLYDVTSTWFEGKTCPLARLGHGRGCKPGRLQIVIGLLCNAEGCPVAVEVFPGNTYGSKTLAEQVEKLRERFGLTRIVLVGDRGMITEKEIEGELKPIPGLAWITALRAPSIQKLATQGAIQTTLLDERNMAEIKSPDYPGERLILCLNPLLAEERTKVREKLLQATERKLEGIARATQRTRWRLKGKAKIGVKVGEVLYRNKMGKHFRIRIGETSLTYARREENIAQEKALDGFYVIRTNVPSQVLGGEETVQAYKRLGQVEQAFRSLKQMDLKVRPIFHHLPDRVRAHVLICMLAYYVEWHMRKALAPLIFDDEDPEAGEARRKSVVEPAKRSLGAEAKAWTRRNARGEPVQSFQNLLKYLGTVTRNLVCVKGVSDATFIRLGDLTPLQQRAFDLLGVKVT